MVNSSYKNIETDLSQASFDISYIYLNTKSKYSMKVLSIMRDGEHLENGD